MKPIGLHVTCTFPGDDFSQPAGHGLYHWLDNLQPAVVVINNNGEAVAHLAARYPDTTFVYRIHARSDGAPTDDDAHLYDTAAQTVERMQVMAARYGIDTSRVWFAFNNEPTSASIPDRVRQLEDWRQVADHAVEVYWRASRAGLKVVGPHFGVKSIPMGDPEVWGILAPMFRAAVEYAAMIGLHPYSPGPSALRTIPTPSGDWQITAAWWTEELAQIIEIAPAIRVILSEIGSEPVPGVPGAGTWQDLQLSGAEYAGQLTWLWDSVFAPYAANIVGACVFAWDNWQDESSRWQSWSVRGDDGVRDTLAAWEPVVGVGRLPVAAEPVPPEPEPEPVPEPDPAPTAWWRRVLLRLAAWLERAAGWLRGLAA